MRSVLRRPLLAAGAITVAIGTVAACGGGSSGGQQVTPKSGGASIDSAAAALVPANVKSKGTLDIGTDSTYAPSEFVANDGHTVIGFDVDLFDAVAAKLGLKTNYETASFGSIINGVNAGKYDVGVSSFTINKEREGQAIMVSYFNAGIQWATKSGNPTGISPDNACGKHVAVQTNTVEVDDLKQRSKTCTDAGKSAIGIDQYTAQDAATAAAVSGKDDAVVADSPVMAYAVSKTHGELQLVGSIYEAAPYGYVLPKGETKFGQALAMGVKDVMQDGTYAQVLKKWGVSAGAVTNSEVNPPVSS